MKRLILTVVLLTGLAFYIQAGTTTPLPSGRYISVMGKGTITVNPDVVSLKLSIKKTDKKAAVAKEETDKVLIKLNRVFENLGIATNKINTSQLYIYPAYDYVKGKRILRGYEVTRNIELTKIDINKLNSLVQDSVKAGINNISRINLSASNKDDLEQQALIKAAENAKVKAKQLAVNFNATLGNVRSISTSNVQFEIPYINTRSMNSFAFGKNNAASPEAPITHAGTITIKAQLQAVFDLKILNNVQGL